MFVGREKELKALEKELYRNTKSAILIYGRRRIGKTTLIEKALEDDSRLIIRFTAIPDELSENARRLSSILSDVIGVKGLLIPNFEEVLKYIASLKEQIIFVIDEYQDLRRRAKGEVVDAYFRDFIDNMPDNIKLILSGSSIRIMKSLEEKDNPLYQRFSLEIPLGELNYLESSLFYSERSVREKISLYAVFGGIPMILSMINPSLSVEENIRELLLNRNGLARSYVENILRDETSSYGGAYSAIIRIGNGKKTFSEIESHLDDKTSRNSLDYTLKELLKADFIDKKQPINFQGNRKKTFYELKINILRFYLTYVEKNPISSSSSIAFFEKYVRPSLNTFVSYRFEAIARSYFEILMENGIRNDIICVGSYWYDDSKNKTNGEFDVAIETIDGFEIYEVKFLNTPMSDDLIKEETMKMSHITDMNVKRIGFISSSGFVNQGDLRLSADDIYNVNLNMKE